MGDRLPDFEYHSPATLSEALSLLTRLDGAVVLQGGTDLLVAAKLKGARPRHVVSLRRLGSVMVGVREERGDIHIGAGTTFDALVDSDTVRTRLPALHEAVRLIGSRQIRNAATIGGNLCNASPAADSAPPLLVLGATLKIHGVDGDRSTPIEAFFKGPGKTSLNRGEILTEVVVPSPGPGSGAAFEKMGRRVSEDISVVSAAAFVTIAKGVVGSARIALGSVAPTPIRASKTEELLQGKKPSENLVKEAGSTAQSECNPIADVRASASYRKKMVAVLVRATVTEAIRRSGGGGV